MKQKKKNIWKMNYKFSMMIPHTHKPCKHGNFIPYKTNHLDIIFLFYTDKPFKHSFYSIHTNHVYMVILFYI